VSNNAAKKVSVPAKAKKKFLVHIKLDTGYEPILDLDRLTGGDVMNDSKELKLCQKDVKSQNDEKKKKAATKDATTVTKVVEKKKTTKLISNDTAHDEIWISDEEDKENMNPKTRLNKDRKQVSMPPTTDNEKKKDSQKPEKRKPDQRELLDKTKQISSPLSKTPKSVKSAKPLGHSSARKEQQPPSRAKPAASLETAKSQLTSSASASSDQENPEPEPTDQIRSAKSNNNDDLSASETSCHHCGQKSSGRKTVCKSGKCHGHRGQFCAGCLKAHYKEELKEALRDPTWQCPPCRNACKCLQCRNRGKGKRGSAILNELAVGRGYKSVRDYLESLIQKLD
jgi:hypothetical protein